MMIADDDKMKNSMTVIYEFYCGEFLEKSLSVDWCHMLSGKADWRVIVICVNLTDRNLFRIGEIIFLG